MLNANFFTKHNPYVWAALISLAFSFLCAQSFFINSDGVLYIDIAKTLHNDFSLILNSELPLPFYSALISIVYTVTPFSWVNAALFINAFFFILLVTGYIYLITNLGGTSVTRWLAAIIILSHPMINHFRGDIIRDVGFWASLYWSLAALIKYQRTMQLRYIFLWYFVSLSAAFMRLEGILLAFLGPLIMLSFPSRQNDSRLKRSILFYGFNIIFILAALVISSFSQNTFLLFTKLKEAFQNWGDFVFTGFIQNLHLYIMRIEAILPPFFHHDFVILFFIGGLTFYFVARLFFMITPLYGMLFLYGVSTRCQPAGNNDAWRIIKYWGVITLFIPVIFLMNNMFVSGRYVFPACLIGLLLIPFALENLYTQYLVKWHNKYPKCSILFVSILLISLLIKGLMSFGYSKQYIIDAGQWIDKHSTADSSIYTNSAPLKFYAQRAGYHWSDSKSPKPLSQMLQPNAWKDYDYIAIVVDAKKPAMYETLLKSLSIKPIAYFSNKRGDTAYIFQHLK